MTTNPQHVSGLLARASQGDDLAVATLMPLVYDELRRLAARFLRRERAGQTLQPTALVHEAYLRLLKDQDPDWRNRTHFVGIAARAMRQILIERARARDATKRGGSRTRVTFDEGIRLEPAASIDILALNEALERLTALDRQQAQIVELRFFGGLTVEETADLLCISAATVKRDWSVAKAWLFRELEGPGEDQPKGRGPAKHQPRGWYHE